MSPDGGTGSSMKLAAVGHASEPDGETGRRGGSRPRRELQAGLPPAYTIAKPLPAAAATREQCAQEEGA